MLTTPLIHPPLLQALAKAGHGSKILIADGNYPFATATGPNTTTVWLNVSPGLLTVDQVLGVLTQVLKFEAGHTMRDESDQVAPPHAGYQHAIGRNLAIESASRFDFYDLARGEDLAVLIATGDQRTCANLLLTVGVRTS